MRRLWSWIKGWFVERYHDDDEYYDDDDVFYDDEDDDEVFSPSVKNERSRRSFSHADDLGHAKITAIHKSATTSVDRISPNSMEEADVVCQMIKDNILVVVNLNVKDQGSEELNEKARIHNQRICDYICGIVRALDGEMRKPDDDNNNLFLVGSQNVIFEWDDDASLKKNVAKDFMSFSSRRF